MYRDEAATYMSMQFDVEDVASARSSWGYVMDDDAPDRDLDWQSDLADVTEADLLDLAVSTDTVLANSIKRLLTEVRDSQEVVAGHGNGVR
jgi:FXSXX-COOH protein